MAQTMLFYPEHLLSWLQGFPRGGRLLRSTRWRRIARMRACYTVFCLASEKMCPLILQGLLGAHACGGIRAGDAQRLRAPADGLPAGGAGVAVPWRHGAAGGLWIVVLKHRQAQLATAAERRCFADTQRRRASSARCTEKLRPSGAAVAGPVVACRREALASLVCGATAPPGSSEQCTERVWWLGQSRQQRQGGGAGAAGGLRLAVLRRELEAAYQKTIWVSPLAVRFFYHWRRCSAVGQRHQGPLAHCICTDRISQCNEQSATAAPAAAPWQQCTAGVRLFAGVHWQWLVWFSAAM